MEKYREIGSIFQEQSQRNTALIQNFQEAIYFTLT